MSNEVLRLKCRSCGADIQADDTNVQTGVAKCRSCGAVFTFSKEIAAAQPRPELKLPGGMKVEDFGSHFVISRRWFSCVFIFLAVFCVLWDGFLIGWYSSLMYAGSATGAGGLQLVFMLFPIVHVGVGVWLSYYTLAGFLNTTTISVDAERISVRHAPLPWRGNKDIPTLEVKQIYCKQKIHRGEDSDSYSYSVHVILKDGSTQELVSGLMNDTQALYIEQLLEKRLLIEDEPVPGAYTR